MNNDLISRQAAIDALVKRTHLDWEYLKIIYPFLDVFEQLPSAQRERTGRWIKPKNPVSCSFNEWICSCCNHLIFGKHKFCPNCGAKMDGGEE